MSGRSAAVRLSLFYAAVFALVGVLAPFWPVWLAARGLGPAEISLVLAVPMWVKVIGNPLAGLAADASGRRRRLIVALAAATLAFYLLYTIAETFAAILAVALLVGAAFSALVPLGDNLAVATSYALKLDYGRLRLWGSLSFIAAALLAGLLLGGAPPSAILALLIGCAALVVIASLFLPEHVAAERRRLRRDALRRLLLDRRLLLFLLAEMLVQGSHSVYYAFGTLHWRALGYSSVAISLFWAEGVVAEIALFYAGAPLVRRLGPAGLLILAAAAGILRWAVTAVAETPAPLAAVQTLHAFTFGAAHLGAMHFIQRTVAPALSATAQSLYSALATGLGAGLAMWAAGRLFAAFGAGAYLGMAVLCAASLAAAIALARREGELTFAGESPAEARAGTKCN
jgi:PPP family 3-phenylpropionic acid transporter